MPEKHFRVVKEVLPTIDIAIENIKREALHGELGEDAKRSVENDALLPTEIAMLALIEAFRLDRSIVERYGLHDEAELMYFAAHQHYVNPEEVVIYDAWKTYKQVFRFDPSFGEEIKDQEISETLPASVLEHMPYPLLYVECETPLYDLAGVGDTAAGFFAFIDWDKPLPDPEGEFGFSRHPHLICNLLAKPGSTTIVEIRLDVPTLNDAVSHLVESTSRSHEMRASMGLKVDERAVKLNTDEHMRTVMTQVLNLMLYICSENADIQRGYAPAKPSSKNPKKKNRRSEASVQDVGYRIARAIREHRAGEGANAETGAKVAPHVRRAHWHHFWRGPLDGERELVLRWLPPIPVNLDKGEAIPTVHVQ